MNVNWYINRLKTMSVPELVFRVDQMVTRKVNKLKNQSLFPEKQLIALPPKLLDTKDLPYHSYDTHFDILGVEWDYTRPIDWHKDIRTNGTFPLVFCREVNTRTDENGIAKYVWEPNRHQFLTRIAQQYQATKDQKYLHLFQSVMESWIEQNPYLIGVNWYSNIEVNVRILTWFLCWEILDVNEVMERSEPFRKFVNEKWVPLIYLHCKYSHDFPSRFSSANNHRISECVGLFVASSYWKFEESAKWNRHAKKVTEQELIKQHTESGINREETSEYMQFITDFFLIAHVVAEKTGNPFSSRFKSLFHKVFLYLYHLVDVEGNINHYGDGDDGRPFILEEDKEEFNNFLSLLTSGAIIFNDPNLKSRCNGFDLKNRILFGNDGEYAFDSIEEIEVERTSRFYEKDGHFLFRKEDGPDQEIFLHYDVAPLGFLGIAAHGHSDALSFYMGVDGQFVFIDPGTYTYHTDMEWRNYFISTLAHNTVCVDNENQALRGGPTMWVRHYKAEVVEVQKDDMLERVTGRHNGYQETGVIHTRTIAFNREKDRFTIIDEIEVQDQNEHNLKIPFHLHPEIVVNQLSSRDFNLQSEDARPVSIHFQEDLQIERVKGQESPILGWYSPSFYKKEPCEVLLAQITVNKSITIKTEIQIHESID